MLRISKSQFTALSIAQMAALPRRIFDHLRNASPTGLVEDQRRKQIAAIDRWVRRAAARGVTGEHELFLYVFLHLVFKRDIDDGEWGEQLPRAELGSPNERVVALYNEAVVREAQRRYAARRPIHE